MLSRTDKRTETDKRRKYLKIIILTVAENIYQIIKRNVKKAPVHDKITADMLKALPDKANDELKDAIDDIMQCNAPEDWTAEHTLEYTLYGFRQTRRLNDNTSTSNRRQGNDMKIYICVLSIWKRLPIKSREVYRAYERQDIIKIFQKASGHRQGCILSPLLFTIVLDEVIKKQKNEK
ncbi:hypothetical protein JTB14_018806 [Gonioctena quinquepunctata]|nr:hypothetical protein JTB14_018806 [Gonioctena quinquepunctata]